MAAEERFILGFDPGGKGAFGWSLCKPRGEQLCRVKTGLADNAQHALSETRKAIECIAPHGKFKVLAAGIDAPLLWSKKGKRKIEQTIRDELQCAGFPTNKVGGTVQDVNNLRGACSIQGVLLANDLYKKCFNSSSEGKITEAHPSALNYLLKDDEALKELLCDLKEKRKCARTKARVQTAQPSVGRHNCRLRRLVNAQPTRTV